MTDFEKFKYLLYNYLKDSKNCAEVQRGFLFESFVSEIQKLKCNDFRYYFLMAYYQNNKNILNEAKTNIDKSIENTQLITNNVCDILENGENSTFLFINQGGENNGMERIPLEHIHRQLADVFFCAGEIYSKLCLFVQALEHYKTYHYYNSFLKTEFSNETTVSLYSFRRYNEYSLADLINNTITVCPSSMMNDPLDSVINLWATEEHLGCICSEKQHVKPYSDSFGYFRIRSFCQETDNPAYKNVLMWSHYADEHKGFCVKYKFSRNFICQEENEKHEHMYLKSIIYSNAKINVGTLTIDSDLAYATKNKQWQYENEVRLIVYNPNHKENFYGIDLDKQSSIEAIYFGYRCTELTINTIKNIFKHNNVQMPKFYKMVLNKHDIYNMGCEEI